MKIKALHQYAKDVDTVFGLFHEPDFMKTKYEGIGARNVGMRDVESLFADNALVGQRLIPAGISTGTLGVCTRALHARLRLLDDGLLELEFRLDICAGSLS